MRNAIITLLLCTALSCIAADSAVIPFTENAIVVKNQLIPTRSVLNGNEGYTYWGDPNSNYLWAAYDFSRTIAGWMVDSSTNFYHIQPVAGGSIITAISTNALGQVNYAPLFDGVNKYYAADAVSCPFNITTSFTAFAYVNASKGGYTNATIVSLGIAAGPPAYQYQILAYATNSYRFIVCNDNNSSIYLDVRSQAISTGVWHSVAMSWSAGNSIRAYIDGVFSTSNSISGYQTLVNTAITNGVSAAFEVGGTAYAGLAKFNGYVDAVRAYSVVLSDSEIATLHQKLNPLTNFVNFAPVQYSLPQLDNIVARYDFTSTNAAGFTINDTSGRANNMTNSGNKAYAVSVTNEFNGANWWYHFDRNGAKMLAVDHYTLYNSNALTMACWAKLDVGGGAASAALLTKLPNDSWNTGYANQLYSGWRGYIDNYSGSKGYTVSTNAYPINEWGWYAFTYSGTGGYIRAWKDNVRVVNMGVANNGVVSNVGKLCIGAIGAFSDTYSLSGSVDSVYMWTNTLSATDMRRVMTLSYPLSNTVIETNP